MRETTPAWVLRRVRWSESSLILTLYSMDQGRISVMAKGALRPGGRFHGMLELLAGVEVTVTKREGRDMSTLTDVSLIEPCTRLRADPEAFAHACLISEWVQGLFMGGESAGAVYGLLGAAFSALPESRAKWAVTCASIETMLRLAGHGMEIDVCVRCGLPAGGSEIWSHGEGGLVCAGCAMPGETAVSKGILEFIRTCRRSGFDTASRTRLWKGGFRACHDFMREFAQAHNQSGLRLRSLGVLEDLEHGAV